MCEIPKNKDSLHEKECVECNVCGQSHRTEACVFLSQSFPVQDAPTPTRARLTLPSNLDVRNLADGSTTVVARSKFSNRTRFGPFQAPHIATLPPEIDFPLKIFGSSDSDFLYLDTRDENQCNWMCLVTSLESASEEQNVMCYQVGSELFFSLLRDVEQGEELRVWYSPFYAVRMGVAVKLSVPVKTACLEGSVPADEKEPDDIELQYEPSVRNERHMRTSKTRKHHETKKKTEKPHSSNNHKLDDDAALAEVVNRLPAARLGARFAPSQWRCRECGATEMSVVSYAHHLKSHLQPRVAGKARQIMHNWRRPQEQTGVVGLQQTTVNGAMQPKIVPLSGNSVAHTLLLNAPTAADDPDDPDDPPMPTFLAAQTQPQPLHVPLQPPVLQLSVSSQQTDAEKQIVPFGTGLQGYTEDPAPVDNQQDYQQGEKLLSQSQQQVLLLQMQPQELEQALPVPQEQLQQPQTFPQQPTAQLDPQHMLTLQIPDSPPDRSGGYFQSQAGPYGFPLQEPESLSLLQSPSQAGLDQLLQLQTPPLPASPAPLLLRSPEHRLEFPRLPPQEQVPPSDLALALTPQPEMFAQPADNTKASEEGPPSTDSGRTLVAVMGESGLNCLVFPVDDISPSALVDSFKASKSADVPRPAVPASALNQEFFTRVVGESMLQDMDSLLRQGYGLQFLVHEEDGSSALVDVLPTDGSPAQPLPLPTPLALPTQPAPTDPVPFALPSIIPDNPSVPILSPVSFPDCDLMDTGDDTLANDKLLDFRAEPTFPSLSTRLSPVSDSDTVRIPSPPGMGSTAGSTDCLLSMCGPTGRHRAGDREVDSTSVCPSNLLNEVLALDGPEASHSNGPPVCEPVMTKDFTDLIAADTEETNTLLVQPEDTESAEAQNCWLAATPTDVLDAADQVSVDTSFGAYMLSDYPEICLEGDQVVDILPEISAEDLETHKLQEKVVNQELMVAQEPSGTQGTIGLQGSCGNQETPIAQSEAATAQENPEPMEVDREPEPEPVPPEEAELTPLLAAGPPYVCDICNKALSRPAYLYRHLRKHTGEFTCTTCQAVFTRKESLKAHPCPGSKTASVREPAFACSLCDKTFSLQKIYKHHMRTVHEDSCRHQCANCQRTYTTAQGLARHTAHCSALSDKAAKGSREPAQSLRCGSCGTMYQSVWALRRHEVRAGHCAQPPEQDSSEACASCGRWLALASPAARERHRRVCEPAAALQSGAALTVDCPDCGEGFAQLVLYRRHVFQHLHPHRCPHCCRAFATLEEHGKHKCMGNWEKCLQCNRQFVTVPQLEQHNIVHGTPTHHCFECGRSFHRKEDFAAHRCFEVHVFLRRSDEPRQVQSNNRRKRAEKSLICDHCGLVYKTNHSLRIHLQKHGEPKFKCNVCNKSFHRKDLLIEHLSVHQQPQFQCVVCNRMLKSKKSLDVHMRQHKNPRRFCCEVCSKTFQQKTHLDKHRQNHHGSERTPLICRCCKRLCYSARALEEHMLRHKPDLQLACRFCERTFTQKRILRQHERRIHQQKISCPACNTTLKQAQCLKEHIRRAHPELSSGPLPIEDDMASPSPEAAEVLLTLPEVQLTTEGVRPVISDTHAANGEQKPKLLLWNPW